MEAKSEERQLALPLSLPCSPRNPPGPANLKIKKPASLADTSVGASTFESCPRRSAFAVYPPRTFSSRLPSTRTRFPKLFQPTPSALVERHVTPRRYPSLEQLRNPQPPVLRPLPVKMDSPRSTVSFNVGSTAASNQHMERQIEEMLHKTDEIVTWLDSLEGTVKTQSMSLQNVLEVQKVLYASEKLMQDVQTLSRSINHTPPPPRAYSNVTYSSYKSAAPPPTSHILSPRSVMASNIYSNYKVAPSSASPPTSPPTRTTTDIYHKFCRPATSPTSKFTFPSLSDALLANKKSTAATSSSPPATPKVSAYRKSSPPGQHLQSLLRFRRELVAATGRQGHVPTQATVASRLLQVQRTSQTVVNQKQVVRGRTVVVPSRLAHLKSCSSQSNYKMVTVKPILVTDL